MYDYRSKHWVDRQSSYILAAWKSRAIRMFSALVVLRWKWILWRFASHINRSPRFSEVETCWMTSFLSPSMMAQKWWTAFLLWNWCKWDGRPTASPIGDCMCFDAWCAMVSCRRWKLCCILGKIHGFNSSALILGLVDLRASGKGVSPPTVMDSV